MAFFVHFWHFFCFVFLKGGDKLTLALGSNNNKNISGSPTSPPTSTGHGGSPGGGPGSPPMDKLINLDSPTSNTSAGAPLLPLRAEGPKGPGATGGPPLPPPRTTSDPSYNINKTQKTSPENNHNSSTNTTKNISNEDLLDTLTNENNNDSTNLSVTYFSSGLNGHGIERETIFTDDRRPSVSASLSKDAASIVRQHLGGISGSNPFTNNYSNSSTTTPSKNPFLLDSSSTTGIEKNNSETLDDIVEKKIQDLINANPFNNVTSGTTGNSSGNGSGGGSGNGNGGKFNTIGRSNPFSSPNTSKNPFLDQKSGFTDQKSSGGLTDQKITSSGEDVNDSPDSSLEPEDHHNGLLHETPSINKIVSTYVK